MPAHSSGAAPQVEAVGNLAGRSVGDDDACRSSRRRSACGRGVGAVVGVGEPSSQILLVPALAGLAVPAGVDHAADADRSPALNRVTPRPDLATRPTISWPGTIGKIASPHSLRTLWMSEWQTPQKRMSITTSSARGSRRSKLQRRQPVLRRMGGVTQNFRDHGESSSKCGSSSRWSCNQGLRPKDACEDRCGRNVDKNICTSSRLPRKLLNA